MVKAKTALVPIEVFSNRRNSHGQWLLSRHEEADSVIGIKDRRRHVYIIGKTGVGKSVLLHDLAIQDIKAGHGVFA